MTTTLAKRPTDKAKTTPKTEAKTEPRGKDSNLAARVFERVKQEIFDFVLLPGDRFTEAEIAGRMQVSRTPVREALYLLEREGYLEVMFRSGWRVRPFDFQQFEDLYDVRVILELAAVKRLCEMDERATLDDLKNSWLVPKPERLTDGRGVAALDEQFHGALVLATGNQEMARIHHDLTERIRIIRRLDFTQDARIDATYNEHARILKAILLRKADEAQMLLKSHIDASKAEVRKITLHMLHTARVQQA
ncbi:MAG: GntR family transcriptional regulator [Betaproteobacteria bacterium]|nr:GntR family transcriptional regulator [Betaproteobacteria bacterium]